MSQDNQISVEIPVQTTDTLLQSLQEAKNALAPFLQALTNEERANMLKMGDKSAPTVQKVKSYLETNPEFAPSYMDKVEFLKDEAVVSQLTPISNILNQLASDVEDTLMLAGSEALKSSLLYYGQVKEANNKGVTSAKPIYEDLKKRFSKR
ncbi:hypothetical protein [Aquimarina algicola]|uniref:Uncharacterized protein n=1 Tax=Aquimarina algicola TaxID=2589995 RepID=A0A504J5C9_9FLAO|nr:hypothetical protein [Aquimarina algicola]TPN82803.1 hypothetical protein FHK87_20465 [Aquimarina algicola]